MILGVAAAGLAIGHWITYAFGMPDAHVRSRVLADTGHGYLGLATQLAVAAGIASLAIVFALQLTRRTSGQCHAGTFLWLAGFQVAAFVALEVLERLAAGSPLDHLVLTAILPIGLVVQVVIAASGALLLRLLLKMADAAADIANVVLPPAAGSGMPLLPALLMRAADPARGSAGIRGPPLSSTV